MLGKALHSAGIINNVTPFENKSTRQDILRHFSAIHSGLNNFGITLESNLAQKIINKEPGSVHTLIKQIVLSTQKYRPVKIENLNRDTEKKHSKVNVPISSLLGKSNAKQEESLSLNEQLQRKYSEIRDLNEEESKKQREMDDHTRA